MKRKTIMAVAAAGLLAISAAGMTETAEAAIGGMRAPRMTTPRMTTPRPQTPRINTPPQSARPNQQYRPSQKAGDIPSAAPSGRAGMNSVPYHGTPWGNMMRNMGVFAGGMMLGGLLGHLFGFGAGSFMGDLFGLLLNGLLIYFVIRFLSRFLGSLRSGAAARKNPCRQEPQNAPFPIPDVRPPQKTRSAVVRSGSNADYEPKRTADWYRSR